MVFFATQDLRNNSNFSEKVSKPEDEDDDHDELKPPLRKTSSLSESQTGSLPAKTSTRETKTCLLDTGHTTHWSLTRLARLIQSMTQRLWSPIFLMVAYLHSPLYRLVYCLVSTHSKKPSTAASGISPSPLLLQQMRRQHCHVRNRLRFGSYRFVVLRSQCAPVFIPEASASSEIHLRSI